MAVTKFAQLIPGVGQFLPRRLTELWVIERHPKKRVRIEQQVHGK